MNVDDTANNESTHTGRWLLHRVVELVEIGVLLSIVAVLCGFCGRWYFLPDLASHFRIQATLVLVNAFPILLIAGRWRWAMTSGIFGACLLLSMTPFWRSTPVVDAAEHRLVSINVLSSNPRKDLVVDFIHASDPDFILLEETTEEWIRQIDEACAERWPYHVSRVRDDNCGIALYSKLPWEVGNIVEFSKELDEPAVLSEFRLPSGKQLRLIGIHPIPPMNQAFWRDRNATFAGVAAEVVKHNADRTIVAGDFNCTTWSYWFKKMLRDSQLRNSSLGQGLGISWMPIPLTILGLPIDHVLVGSEITVTNRTVGPYVGSDHRPVIVDFR